MTDLSVTNWLVSQGILSEVVTNHVSSDFNWVPVFARVDFAHGGYHLWHNDAITKMSLDWLWLLSEWSILDGLDELFDESIVTSLVVSFISHSSSLSGSEHCDDLVSWHGNELLKLDSSVNLLSECFFLGLGPSHGLIQPLLNGTHI